MWRSRTVFAPQTVLDAWRGSRKPHSSNRSPRIEPVITINEADFVNDEQETQAPVMLHSFAIPTATLNTHKLAWQLLLEMSRKVHFTFR